MKQIPENMVLLGVKGAVIAFDRESGQRLWEQRLNAGGFSGGFVTVLADEERVYAHSHGEIFCLDLMTGKLLWQDGLSGMGYGLGGIALPGGQSAPPPQIVQRLHEEQQQAAHPHAHST